MSKERHSPLILLLVIGLIGGAYYLGLQKNSKTQNSTQISSTSETPVPLKTYTDKRFGFSFQYPEEFKVKLENDIEIQYLLSIENSDERYLLEVAPIGKMKDGPSSYPKYPLNRSPQGTKVFGTMTWEYIPPSGFADAGITGATSPTYQIDNGRYRFDFALKNSKEPTPNFEKIISSFKLIN